MDNAFMEAVNGRFRRECLNDKWFLSLEKILFTGKGLLRFPGV
jgi:hypothetical protein